MHTIPEQMQKVNTTYIIERDALDILFETLQQQDFSLQGPTVRDGAIVYDAISSTADLPVGWTEEQDAGSYRLKRRTDNALFGYAVGPHAWKKFLHPPTLRLWQAQREDAGFQIIPEQEESPRFAFIGARSCELHAIAIQDRVFLEGRYVDPAYRARRENLFVIAVNCGQAGGTCFCVSMQTGPKVTQGFDLALTEVISEKQHYFVVEIGTDQGAQILQTVPHREAGAVDSETAEQIVAHTAGQMGRRLDTDGIKDLLYRNADHPRWDDVAERCLTCANCTMVCPTCFCTTVEDTTDLTGDHAERWRRWDSCFTMDFSYLHGGSVRASAKSRYRQWLTHKLASWIDQFGTSGCVGCGRCITWCPVGIDITQEVQAIQESGE